jgi:hypothetical protein
MRDFAREIAAVRDGFAKPFTGIDPATGTFRGCLYTAEGSRLALSLRPSGPGYRFSPGDPEAPDPTVAAPPRLPGRTLYLGHYFAHYEAAALDRLPPLRDAARHGAAALAALLGG